MGDFDPAFVESLKVQSWSLYSVGITIVALRMYARYRRLGGIARWQVDDYIMMVAGVLYTLLIVSLNVISQGGGSNLYPPELEGTFTPIEIEERIQGSKIVVVSEQAMLNVIYAIKACMLIMYTRLTLGLATQRWVRILAVYVFIGWLVTEITFFTACRPFSGYWGMPPPDPQCTTLQFYAYVQGCFNISSDVFMLFIPLPLVMKLHAPWKQKAVLVLIFSMGVFVILAALLTKIFNLTDIWDPDYMQWYVREASVAVYVSNLPMIWPLLRDWFPFLRTLTPRGNSHSYGKQAGGRTGVVGGQSRSGQGRSGTKQSGGVSGQKSRGGDIGDILSVGRSRVRGHASLGSLDDAFDLEIALKETRPGESRDHHSEDGCSSTEIIAERRRGSPDEVANAGGGIKVEHTVVVVEEDRSPRGLRDDESDDRQPQVFDWMQSGDVEHSTRVTRGK